MSGRTQAAEGGTSSTSPRSIVRDIGQYESPCGYCKAASEHKNRGMVAVKLSHKHYQVSARIQLLLANSSRLDCECLGLTNPTFLSLSLSFRRRNSWIEFGDGAGAYCTGRSRSATRRAAARSTASGSMSTGFRCLRSSARLSGGSEPSSTASGSRNQKAEPT